VVQVPSPSRRELLATFAACAGAASVAGRGLAAVRAVAFDAFVLFDPAGILERAREIAGEDAGALVAAATTRLFAYSWFHTSEGSYPGFDLLALGAFRYAARMHKTDVNEASLKYMVDGYSALDVWPDVGGALDRLRRGEIRLAILSNLSEDALWHNLRRNRIDHYFQFVLSTDRARRFKPAPEAYSLGIRAFGSHPGEIGFAASAQWDAVGARRFGYRATWVNRASLPAEEALGPSGSVSAGMEGVVLLAKA